MAEKITFVLKLYPAHVATWSKISYNYYIIQCIIIQKLIIVNELQSISQTQNSCIRRILINGYIIRKPYPRSSGKPMKGRLEEQEAIS